MVCDNWRKYRFKSQLHIGFSLFNFAVMVAIFITIFVFTYVSTQNNENHLRNRLNDVAQGYTRAIVSDSAKVFDRLLTRFARNFLNIIANSASDYTRSNFPFPPTPTYYEWNATMLNPVSDARYNGVVSFDDGGYSVAGKTPYNMATYSAALNKTIQRTEAIVPLVKTLYQGNPGFVGGYYCLGYDNKVFREYPAASNGNYSQMLAYDCSKDDWYKLGITGLSSRAGRQTYYSGVYIDAWIKQAMITIVQPIYEPVTGAILGTAGADLLTSDLQNKIASLKYLSNGRSILWEVDVSTPNTGIVIADTARQPNLKQTTLQTYRNLASTGLSITSSLWSQIFQTNGYTVQSTFVELDDYYVASQPLAAGNNQYLLSVFVYKRDVVAALDPVISDISTARKRAIIVNSVVCAAVLLIAALVNMILATYIVRPIEQLTADSDVLIAHIGHENLAKGLAVREADSMISETRALQLAHAQMIATIQQQHAAARAKELAAQAAQAQKIDYALPAYVPGQAFDQSFLAQASYAPAYDNLPVGVAISAPASASSSSSPPQYPADNGSYPPSYPPSSAQPQAPVNVYLSPNIGSSNLANGYATPAVSSASTVSSPQVADYEHMAPPPAYNPDGNEGNPDALAVPGGVRFHHHMADPSSVGVSIHSSNSSNESHSVNSPD